MPIIGKMPKFIARWLKIWEIIKIALAFFLRPLVGFSNGSSFFIQLNIDFLMISCRETFPVTGNFEVTL